MIRFLIICCMLLAIVLAASMLMERMALTLTYAPRAGQPGEVAPTLAPTHALPVHSSSKGTK